MTIRERDLDVLFAPGPLAQTHFDVYIVLLRASDPENIR